MHEIKFRCRFVWILTHMHTKNEKILCYSDARKDLQWVLDP